MRRRTWDQDRGTHTCCSTIGMSSAGLPSGRPEPRPTSCRCSSIRSIRSPIRPWAAAPSPPGEVFERATRRYSKPDFGITRTRVDGQSVAVTEEVVWQTPFCRLLHFKRDIDPGPRRATSAPAAGGAHVGPLRHAAARHGGDVPARPRGLHHRLAGCAQRAAVGRPLRPRRLHRHHGRHVPLLRRRCACVRRVPAVRAGAGRHRADGGGRRSRRAADADRLPAGRSTRASTARSSTRWPRSAAPIGSAATSSPTCRGRSRAAAGRSIRASCSCRAS